MVNYQLHDYLKHKQTRSRPWIRASDMYGTVRQEWLGCASTTPSPAAWPEICAPPVVTSTWNAQCQQTVEEAIRDVTAWWPEALEWFGIDVTVRYAGATRYTGAPRRAGQAADAAESEKRRRYGRDVLPLAFEAGGRMGSVSMQSLQVV